VSELLAQSLADTTEADGWEPLAWTARPMKPRVDLADKDAVQRLLDADR
jgi:hypothetical protein